MNKRFTILCLVLMFIALPQFFYAQKTKTTDQEIASQYYSNKE